MADHVGIPPIPDDVEGLIEWLKKYSYPDKVRVDHHINKVMFNAGKVDLVDFIERSYNKKHNRD